VSHTVTAKKTKMVEHVDIFKRLLPLARKGPSMSLSEVGEFMALTSELFREVLVAAGFDERQILRLTTKFRDACRRSAPWKPTSSKVPGRPQDGADGNRINRWLLPKEHKFYADEKTATLTEIKYYYQALSMENAPSLGNKEFCKSLVWLLGHNIEPGAYRDPLQLVPIDLKAVIDDASRIQSGHLVPLDRGGKHEPKNTFLMLKGSNALQGNYTVDELLNIMEQIVNRHKARKK